MKLLLLASLLAVPAIAEAADPPSRVRNATVYGTEACPKPASDDEVVVCARLGEGERYRIPKRLRAEPSQAAAAQSWANRADTAMEDARLGRPNSCSAIGTNGQTGCTAAMLRQWFADRRAQAARNARIP